MPANKERLIAETAPLLCEIVFKLNLFVTNFTRVGLNIENTKKFPHCFCVSSVP